jgi:DNA-directed RNA polymerase subunit alpha
MLKITLKTKINELSEDTFNTRIYNCFANLGINTIEDLVNFSEQDLFKMKNFGRHSFNIVINFLKENKLPHLKMSSINHPIYYRGVEDGKRIAREEIYKILIGVK